MQRNNRFDETSMKIGGDFMHNSVAGSLLIAYRRAMAIEHKLTAQLIQMQGMSGRKYRYFINNFVSLLPDPRYLEVGSWAGSTACAAMYGNRLELTCIDNWSEFGGPKEQFLYNIEVTKNPAVNFKFVESDFRNVDFSQIGKFNIYLFDGPHTERDQYEGVKLAQVALEDCFTLIVDDWNWQQVRQGTMRAIRECDLKVNCYLEIRTTQNNNTPILKYENSEWHNGYFIALCSKIK
jgi:hypothetical protein